MAILIVVNSSLAKYEARKEDVIKHIKSQAPIKNVITYGLDLASDKTYEEVLTDLRELSMGGVLVELNIRDNFDPKKADAASVMRRAATFNQVLESIKSEDVNVLIHDDRDGKKLINDRFVFYTSMYYKDMYMSNIPLPDSKLFLMRNKFGQAGIKI